MQIKAEYKRLASTGTHSLFARPPRNQQANMQPDSAQKAYQKVVECVWGENNDMAWFAECVSEAVENIKKRKENASAEEEGERTVVFRLSVPRNGRRDERLSCADRPSLAKAKNTTYYTLRAVLEVLLECKVNGYQQVAGFDVDVCIFAVVAAVFECAKFERKSLPKLLKGPGTKGSLREVESMIVDVALTAVKNQCVLVMQGIVRDALVAGIVEGAEEGTRDAFGRMVKKVAEQVDLPNEKMYNLQNLDNAMADRESFQVALDAVYATNMHDAIMWKNKRKGDAAGGNEEHQPQSKRRRTDEEAGSGSAGNGNANGAGGANHQQQEGHHRAKAMPRGSDVGGGETGIVTHEKYVNVRGDMFAEVGVYTLRDERAMKMLRDGWDKLVTEQKLLSPEDVMDLMDKMVLLLVNAM